MKSKPKPFKGAKGWALTHKIYSHIWYVAVPNDVKRGERNLIIKFTRKMLDEAGMLPQYLVLRPVLITPLKKKKR